MFLGIDQKHCGLFRRMSRIIYLQAVDPSLLTQFIQKFDIVGNKSIFTPGMGNQAHSSASVTGFYNGGNMVRYKSTARFPKNFSSRFFACTLQEIYQCMWLL